MNNKFISLLFCTLLVISAVLTATGKINIEENVVSDILLNMEDDLEVECERYEEKCHNTFGFAAGRWVYKYTVKNVGSTNVEFDHLTVEFPTQMFWVDIENGAGPAGWGVTYDLEDNTAVFGAESGFEITLGPGGTVNNFIVKTDHFIQIGGGADAIPTEGLQNWTAGMGSLPVDSGQVLNEKITPKVYENGGGYKQEFPAENSYDKDHETYSIVIADKEFNWVTYDFEAVRQFREFKLYSRNDSLELTSPAEIEIAVGSHDDGTIDVIVGEYLLPPAVNGEIVVIDLGVILEKRFVRLSVLSRYYYTGEIIPPIESEYAEVEFTTLMQPANHKPYQPHRPTGEIKGNTGKPYTYWTLTTDEDGDFLRYLFDWGDGTDSGWGDQHPSGDIAEAVHSWTEDGTYEVKVKAKDKYNIESDWSEPLTVRMPRSRILTSIYFLRLLELLPNAFPIVRYILGLQ